MILKISKNKEENIITVTTGSVRPLRIAEDSEDWNTEGVNNFLIKVASQLGDEDIIKVNPKLEDIKEEDGKDFEFIVKLFTEFANEYNLKEKK